MVLDADNFGVGEAALKECFSNNLVSDVGAVKIGGVDVVDTKRNSLTQDSDRFIKIPWWTPEFGIRGAWRLKSRLVMQSPPTRTRRFSPRRRTLHSVRGASALAAEWLKPLLIR